MHGRKTLTHFIKNATFIKLVERNAILADLGYIIFKIFWTSMPPNPPRKPQKFSSLRLENFLGFDKLVTHPGPFSRTFSQARGGGLKGPDAKNQGYHQPIEMKLCMSQYSHKSMPDAKFESASFSSSGDMTSQNFSLKRGTSHKNRIFTPGKWI